MKKRVFLIVLDSLGIGEMPDAESFGDLGANTMKSISKSQKFYIPNLLAMGLGNIDGIDYLPKTQRPTAAVARLCEESKGKDTTVGHWELAGVVSEQALPTYPEGFPEDILDEFTRATGRGWLCNKPYSGTQVIKDYGREHLETGKLIVYTSADSVFQIAAHESLVPPEELYEYCRKARAILKGRHAVGRVIARPFIGEYPDYTRTTNRHDFSLEPTGRTLLDHLSENGKDVIGVGKIYDIFAGRGVTEKILTGTNDVGMKVCMEIADRDFSGLCFINLVDFDQVYGHRNNVDGYALALSEFDAWLPKFLEKMTDDDVVMITADHGCDPGNESTDHSREYVPLLIWGEGIEKINLGTRPTFADVAATTAQLLGVGGFEAGTGFASELTENSALVKLAREAMERSYSPYSGFSVGAALLSKSGRVYTGCNIENAAFSPTVCAERTAFFKAVSEGETEFEAIAVCGGKGGEITDYCPPCGVCRQVMREFCGDDFRIYMVGADGGCKCVTLADILPESFSPDNVK